MIFDQALAKGLIQPEKWEKFALNPTKDFQVDQWEEFMSIKELVQLQKKAYLKFYLRPSFMLKQVFTTRTFYELKTKLKGALKLVR